MVTDNAAEYKEMSQLRYHDQTPLPTKQDEKRRCFSMLSPVDEDDDALSSKLEAAMDKAMAKLMPKIMETIRNEMKDAVADMRAEITRDIQGHLKMARNVNELKTLSEAELLEGYNRRDNVRIIGLKEHNNGEREQYKETIAKVLEVAQAAKAEVLEGDISIAHRLPSRKEGPRPVIVRFCRRVSKVDLLRKKRSLADIEKMKDIKIFEDLTRPRLQFFNIMKADQRFESVWTSQGIIYYILKSDKKTYSIRGLYEGGAILKYDMKTVLSCFGVNRE